MSSSLPKTILTVVLIIAVSAVISTISFTAFYFYITREPTQPTEQPTQPISVILEMPIDQFLTNLADGHYVQVNIVLQYPEIKQRVWFGLREVVDDTLPLALQSNMNQIKDVLYNTLRAQTTSSLNPNNIDRVKAEMIGQINRIINSSRYGISNILLIGMVVT